MARSYDLLRLSDHLVLSESPAPSLSGAAET
jgi:hypothetical protein